VAWIVPFTVWERWKSSSVSWPRLSGGHATRDVAELVAVPEQEEEHHQDDDEIGGGGRGRRQADARELVGGLQQTGPEARSQGGRAHPAEVGHEGHHQRMLRRHSLDPELLERRRLEVGVEPVGQAAGLLSDEGQVAQDRHQHRRRTEEHDQAGRPRRPAPEPARQPVLQGREHEGHRARHREGQEEVPEDQVPQQQDDQEADGERDADTPVRRQAGVAQHQGCMLTLNAT
jgi:hypothetical protein